MTFKLLSFFYVLERLAFRWIQKYISAFGGDPTKVTMYVPPHPPKGTCFLTARFCLLTAGDSARDLGHVHCIW